MIRGSAGRILTCLAVAVGLAFGLPAALRADERERPGSARVSRDWLSGVQQRIAEEEYHVTWQESTYLPDLESAWQAPNRAHDFRTYFTEAGIHVIPRTEEYPSWEWGLALVGYGRGDMVWPVSRARLSPAENRIDYVRGNIVEWYVNSPSGLKQGFTLHERPEDQGAGPAARTVVPTGKPAAPVSEAERGGAVYVELALTGTLNPAIGTDGQAIDFQTGRGVKVVHFAGLRVTDAGGRELPSWMEGFAETGVRGIRIVFHDADAAYPVTVDPLATSSAWTGESNQEDARFGTSVSTSGDVDGDGYADVIVGAHYYDNGETNEGRAYVFRGSASGLSAAPDWTAEGNQPYAYFGYSVSTAGDVNGDGFADVIVGAYGYDNEGTNEGRADVFHGSASGLSPDSNWNFSPVLAYSYFGRAVSAAGDVNGDGYADVIVGADFYDNGQTDEGAAWVFHGSASGLSLGSNWTKESDQAFARFGISVSTAGDVNGDGYADVIVGAPQYDNQSTDGGHAFVYHGSASGLSTDSDWSRENGLAGANFGYAVSTAGDVDGDGYADVIVGAPYYDNGQADEGGAFVIHGSASGLSSDWSWTATGNQEFAEFGSSVFTAGDVNGDGYADVIVGAFGYENGESLEGAAFVFHGSESGLSPVSNWSAESDQDEAYFGYSVSAAGDVNGDGYADVIVGADYYDNGETDEGSAWVYHGSASGLSPDRNWIVEGDQASAGFARSVSAAGDVNGDGYADVIVGAPYFDNGQTDEGRACVYRGSASGLGSTPDWMAEGDQDDAHFGISVSPAGDVNGDGYADVIVGAHNYDNVQTDEGRAFVYHGSVSGLSSVEAWTAENDQAGSQFARSVSTAGDVNGDGYADVIVGAPYFDNGQTDEGRAYVYRGSASGLGSTPDWMAEGDQGDAHFGISVSTAGDVNGDGYTDVIVGAHDYDNVQPDEGRAFVYHGSGSGLSSVEAWTAESDQAGSQFARSVSTAGDVDGDGYADVIVGAHGYDNVQTDEGRTYVYHGSASGLSSVEAWIAEGDQDGAQFGLSVGTAGDVNGDGYADVVVGAHGYDNVETDEGRAFVYHGSASGLSSIGVWTAESDQANARFGYSVGTAGDVDGDGYADVIAGAYDYDNDQTDEGGAFVFHGNDGPGPTLRPEQRPVSDAAPIAPLGVSDTPDSFRLKLLGRSPFGRANVKLEWEVKHLGSLFSGDDVQTGTWTDTGTGGVPLSEVATGLSSGIVYHWRVRLLYDPVSTPYAQHSRWLTIPWNGWQEADLRMPGDVVHVGAGRVPDQSDWPGSPLVVEKAGEGSAITLTWDVSCLTSDTDYEIYEGTLGEFASHSPRFCSTAGATSKTFTPAAGNTYYVIVPRNATREGSYGTGSSGERPQGSVSCVPQEIGACE